MNAIPDPEIPVFGPEIMRFISHMPPKGDNALCLLKGHLLIEELVRKLIDSKMKAPHHLQENRLEFDQCLSLARALTGDEFPEWLWKGLKKLNKLRNDLAHNLEPKGFEDRLKDFVDFAHPYLDSDSGRNVAKFMSPLNWTLAGLYIELGVRRHVLAKPMGGQLHDLLNPEA